MKMCICTCYECDCVFDGSFGGEGHPDMEDVMLCSDCAEDLSCHKCKELKPDMVKCNKTGFIYCDQCNRFFNGASKGSQNE